MDHKQRCCHCDNARPPLEMQCVHMRPRQIKCWVLFHLSATLYASVKRTNGLTQRERPHGTTQPVRNSKRPSAIYNHDGPGGKGDAHERRRGTLVAAERARRTRRAPRVRPGGAPTHKCMCCDALMSCRALPCRNPQVKEALHIGDFQPTSLEVRGACARRPARRDAPRRPQPLRACAFPLSQPLSPNLLAPSTPAPRPRPRSACCRTQTTLRRTPGAWRRRRASSKRTPAVRASPPQARAVRTRQRSLPMRSTSPAAPG